MQRIHLKSPGNWINDPNGFIYYRGQYHLFYQYFPFGLTWGRMHWGHAVSSDLVSWEHKGIALYPTKADDRSGCFSGSAVEDKGKMYIFYTGVSYTDEDPENINVYRNSGFLASQMMISSEDGDLFDNLKDKKTVIPVIENPAVGSDVNTRDPKVWKGRDGWYMILGSTADNKGRFLFYRSSDLEKWDYSGYFTAENAGWMWECPDYFETDGGSIVIFSPLGIAAGSSGYESYPVCAQAEFDEDKCSMKLGKMQLFDIGNDLYAPQSTTDSEGRRTVIAWARMPEAVNGRWIGMFCIPRVVSISDGHIYFRPHPNIISAFSKEITDISQALDGCFRLVKEMSEGESIDIGGYVISAFDRKISADRSAVFAGHEETGYLFETPELKGGYHIDVFADTNLIEVYINDGEYVLSSVVYKTGSEIKGEDYRLYTYREDRYEKI